MGDPNSRAGKRAKREANLQLAEALHNFKSPGEQQENFAEQSFADTVKKWLEHRRGLDAPSTIAGNQYYANDVITYFSEIHPVRTVELTSRMVEEYQNWERMRRQPTELQIYSTSS